ncbi:hypothetical protein ARMGADRAFT_692489 [Armillaria gallica]|uniref:FACT complex subunit n=1 Tax=Armillaria gallica TaxID=47427 RepID=A0A2H3DY18_ARMGA|nr:hypothetical protein ARMGADRAFT_692489 [Armillaria gallica]
MYSTKRSRCGVVCVPAQGPNEERPAFAEKIAQAGSLAIVHTLELDIPFRELSFEGGPYRQRTTECLVHPTDSPFLVVTLAEIEVESLERLQYSLSIRSGVDLHQFNNEFTDG